MSYSSNIGDMLLNVTGSGWLLGLFLMAAFSYLCYRRGYGTLATGFVVYPVAVGIVTGGWLPPALHGFALLGVGLLWGYALIKLMGSMAENSDIQKVFMIVLCWNAALWLSGYGVSDSILATNSQVPGGELDTNWMTTAISSMGLLFAMLGGLASFVFGGSIIAFIAASGLTEPYLTAVKAPLITITILAFYPVIMKIITLGAQLLAAGVNGISRLIPGR